MPFEWGDDKNTLSTKKHGVNFFEACTVFFDEHEVTFLDNRFHDDEQRFITIGMSDQGRLLLVAWTERHTAYRIITAMKAEKKHDNIYRRKQLL
ncbi:MAG: BrnT family toxin [Moraxella sp.]|nr:BrnT family toxin [Moraxella sp.]